MIPLASIPPCFIIHESLTMQGAAPHTHTYSHKGLFNLVWSLIVWVSCFIFLPPLESNKVLVR